MRMQPAARLGLIVLGSTLFLWGGASLIEGLYSDDLFVFPACVPRIVGALLLGFVGIRCLLSVRQKDLPVGGSHTIIVSLLFAIGVTVLLVVAWLLFGKI